MFKIPYASFKSFEFEQSLNKLCGTAFSDEKSLYNAAKILRRFKNESKAAQGRWEELYKPMILKDETGAIVPLDGRPGTFQIRPECQKEWEQLVVDYNETVVEFDCHPITPEMIKEAHLTPKDLVELEPMLAIPL